jgi:hypothetical protein
MENKCLLKGNLPYLSVSEYGVFICCEIFVFLQEVVKNLRETLTGSL